MTTCSLTALLALDQSSAYDVVDHPILLLKLKAVGMDEDALTWMQSYLGDRTQVVEVEGFRSSSAAHPPCSVIQGSIGSCTLYSVYTADLPLLLHSGHRHDDPEEERRCRDPTTTCYVDDAYIAVSEANLEGVTITTNASMKVVEEYMAANKLKLNLSKTAILTFTPTVPAGPIPSTTLITPTGNVTSIESLKILGVTFSRTLRWDKHINLLISQISHKISVLRQMAPYTSTKTLASLASGLVLGRLQYGILIYGHIPAYQQRRLQTLILTAARVCLGPTFCRASTATLLGALKWPSICQMVDMADTKLIHQSLITKTPLGLFSRVSQPKSGGTCEASRASLIVTFRRKMKHRQTITQIGLERYNKLSLNMKMVSSKTLLKKPAEKVHFCH